jgi:hypothetical protein
VGAAHVLGCCCLVEVVAMSSRTPVAIDCIVWFSLADRAGAVDRSIRVSSALHSRVG